jgi:hypothetical protein
MAKQTGFFFIKIITSFIENMTPLFAGIKKNTANVVLICFIRTDNFDKN